MTLHELEPRLTPSPNPFAAEGVPAQIYTLANGSEVAAAGDGGGPRVVGPGFSVYVADPDSRHGVDWGGLRAVLDAAASPVVSVQEVPPQPVGIDSAANSIDGTGGVLRQTIGLYATDAGPTPYGVGLVFDSPPTDERDRYDRALLAREVWTALGRWDVFVATGAPINQARGLATYVEVRVSAPYDADAIAADIAGRLA